jgi:pyruvate/2-oxoglutarate dehydrogenase complex dihydrolipoamide acyltransferase (E2) component
VPIVSVRIPQMGEGLQEALLVEFIKKPGDMVRRDEAIYVMETDKASTEVESPFTGKLLEWTVTEGSVLAIGTEGAKMEVEEEVAASATGGHGHGPATTLTSSPAPASSDSDADEEGAAGSGGVMIPPRTRKYLKEKGLADAAHLIPPPRQAGNQPQRPAQPVTPVPVTPVLRVAVAIAMPRSPSSRSP